VIELIDQAGRSGSRKQPACELLGLSVRTVQRWQKLGLKDQRKGSRACPTNALNEDERDQIANVLVSVEYCDLSPNQMVPRLADQGIYLASESTMYRLLRQRALDRHREASKPATHSHPKTLVATGPNQVWSWDISYLPTLVRGIFFYLYLVLDIYSRKIVAWQIHDREHADHASDLMIQAGIDEQVCVDQITLHSDNGSPMKGATMLATLQKLGIMPSFSRPSVSNDNAYSESLFKTLKYRPEYPGMPFISIAEARKWVAGFVDWYNQVHLHSAIRFVTPNDRHLGNDRKILEDRARVYAQARQKHPERWSGNLRDWSKIEQVELNKSRCSTKQTLDTAA
jgi:transposase InsO family protein